MVKKLDMLPALSGVYIFKDIHGNIIYIGKAKSLKDRVASYFRPRQTDWKIKALMEEYADLEYVVTHTEEEALLLETQLIQKHQPKFNVLFKTGQPFLYIVFTPGTSTTLPSIELVRNKKKKGIYFGPFLHKQQARRVYAYITRTFKLIPCNKKIPGGCLQYHLGSCPGTCRSDFDRRDFEVSMQLAIDVLQNANQAFIDRIQEKIQEYNAQLAFEKSKILTTYLQNIEQIFATIRVHYNPANYAEQLIAATTPSPYMQQDPLVLAKSLRDFLKLDHLVRTIDCFDISHFQSKAIVGSCIRFTDGKADKNKFRRFAIKTLTTQNDYAALQEIILRRYKNTDDLPDLILIDGGKGQLNAVEAILPKAPCVSLAKREETLFSTRIPDGVRLDAHSDVGKLLLALRDYAHHFAITYHRLKRRREL